MLLREAKTVNSDKDLEEFLRRYIDVQAVSRARKPAQEIMISGMPSYVGPRLDIGRSGRKRWVTRLDRKTNLSRFTSQYPVL
jgi:hypothetical protein